MSLIDLKSLNAMFRPQSVAVIGASSDPMKIGGKPIDLMKIWGYSGRIIPVNPKSDVIQDLPAFPSISDVDGDVDLAICAVPGKLAVQAVAQSVAKGVKGMIMFSSGFAETSEDGAATQQEMAAMARAGGMRLMGPNCMGAANLHMGLLATFHRAFETPFKPSNISVVSQSGAFGGFCAFLAAQRGLGLSHMFTTGNEADLEASECLAYLAMDPETDVILLYMEGCRNGPKFIEAMQMARDNKKPVIAIKLGSTDAGAQAAASHTAALAGSDKVFDAILRQYGAYRAHSIEEFLDVAAAAAVGGLPSNDKVGLVTVSGGVGVLMADDAERRGLDVARLPESTQKKFKELVPFAGVNNPLDVTGQVANDPSLYRKAMGKSVV